MKKTEVVSGMHEIMKNNVIILRPHGKLDCNQSIEIEKKVVDHLNSNRTKFLLNLNEISYVNSAGLRMLISIKKQVRSLDGKLMVCELNQEVMEVMKICGFDHVLEITDTEAEALRLF